MSVPLWTVEMHAHSFYSKDCLIRIDALPEICRARGLDKLAITDHNTVKGALLAARLYPMLVVPGLEIMTTRGELLAWYVKEEVPAGLSPLETIQRLRDQGTLIGIAHPFDRHRRGGWRLQDLQEIVDLVDVIEVYNSRCLNAEDNQKSLAFAHEHDKLMICGSDAHLHSEYGRSVMQMEPFANNADGLRRALQSATRREALSGLSVHFGSTYAKWVKRIFPSLRPS